MSAEQEKSAIAPEKMVIEPVPDTQVGEASDEKIMERTWGLEARVDPTVTFEEYVHWADIERIDEKDRNQRYVEQRGPWTIKGAIGNRFSRGVNHPSNAVHHDPDGMAVTDEEWKTASRALKTTSWGTVFFLITTDILGWGSCPYAFASVGYGPGVALYVIFSLFAGFSGFILWRVYLKLDSSRYPILSYGDTFYRIFGPKSRHFINVTQAFQQFMTVAVLILGSGQIIAQLSNAKICYIVCFLIFTLVGMLAGSIRSLQRVGWLANLSVWLNIISFIIVLAAASLYQVDYNATILNTRIKDIMPIMTFAGPPPDAYQPAAVGFAGQFNGINQMVYSWGGALLFVAFLAEMRHPMDFWKGLMVAQVFICVVYVIFGAVVYSKYGQYSAQVITTAINPPSLQTVANVFALLTGAIACVMYFNIGMKTVYIEVFQQVFHFPSISTRKGRWMWYALGPIYWIVAFIVAASIPNLNGISGIVGALLILNFTYTFPAVLYIGFNCQVGAALPGEGFDPSTRITVRHDSGIKRWTRGFMKNWAINLFTLLYFMGGAATSGMGSWAAIESLIGFFSGTLSIATSWGCAVPV